MVGGKGGKNGKNNQITQPSYSAADDIMNGITQTGDEG